ncbi:hypothetical protein GCM10010222_50160 [Streptomyces tanashiensis]|nr:hypothetical protein GCM10010222_50160 [Streptomyces tanashiensis]
MPRTRRTAVATLRVLNTQTGEQHLTVRHIGTAVRTVDEESGRTIRSVNHQESVGTEGYGLGPLHGRGETCPGCKEAPVRTSSHDVTRTGRRPPAASLEEHARRREQPGGRLLPQERDRP